MQPRLQERPAKSLIGYAVRTSVSDNRNEQAITEFWQRYLGSPQERRLRELALTDDEYGICADFDPDSGDFSYSIAVEADPAAPLPDGAVRHQWQPVTCAVFTVPPVADPADFPLAIQQTWKLIMEQWFPNSGYVHADGEECERYQFGNAMEVEIWIPVRPA